MSVAELYGKISSVGNDITENSEDLLTSDIFGATRYLEPNLLLNGILLSARNYNNNAPDIGEIINAQYYFWPNLQRSQPDIIIEMMTSTGKVCCCIENKLYSGLSSQDQLKREWEDLIDRQKSNGFKYGILVFITAHLSFPKDIFHLTMDLLKTEDFTKMFFWLNWYDINKYLKSVEKDIESKYQKAIIEDMVGILDRKGFIKFTKLEIGLFNEEYVDFYTHKSSNKYIWKPIALDTHNFYRGV